MSGPHGALYADFGPSISAIGDCLMCASYFAAGPTSTTTSAHAVIGLRAGLAADVYLWAFTLGLVGAVRAGLPTNDSGVTTEGAASIALRLGFTFDVSATSPKTTASRD